MTAAGLDAVRGLTQPDQRSCGPTSLVAAHMLVDPAYRPVAPPTEILALHRRLTSGSFEGRAQLPWPRALGTPPWAVARAMSSFTGVRYRILLVRWGRRRRAFAALSAAVATDLPCPLYAGSGRLPRHVVLAAAPARDGVLLYDPARGIVVELARVAFEHGELTTLGRWRRPWFAVVPRRLLED